MEITYEYLISLGFKKRFIPSEKKWDDHTLIWGNLFDAGESIDFKIVLHENVWSLTEIKVHGEKTYDLLIKNVKKMTLEDILPFILKYPYSTNP